MIENGSVQVEEFLFGSEVFYSCDPGFELQGPSRRICHVDKKWSPSAPSCMRKQQAEQHGGSFPREQGNKLRECFCWLPRSLPLQLEGCNRRSQRKSQQRSSHWQFLSDLKGASFGTLKWHKLRLVLRSVGEECGLLYLICLVLWCAGPWTSCAGMAHLCHAKANTSWQLCMSGDQDSAPQDQILAHRAGEGD